MAINWSLNLQYPRISFDAGRPKNTDHPSDFHNHLAQLVVETSASLQVAVPMVLNHAVRFGVATDLLPLD
jgi:hypothetical protein